MARKRFDQLPEVDGTALDFGNDDICMAQVDIEMDTKELSFDARSLLKSRLCGYNNYDLTRRKFISRWKLEKAEKELVAFGEQYANI